jgi:hypothetical protein
VSETFAISTFSQLINICFDTAILFSMGFNLLFWEVVAALRWLASPPAFPSASMAGTYAKSWQCTPSDSRA